jgi:putative inorganic carbon (hco3(-)) transporter
MKLKNILNLINNNAAIFSIITIAYYIILFLIAIFVNKFPDKLVVLALFFPALFSLFLIDTTKTILGVLLLQIGIQVFFDQNMVISNFSLIIPLLIGLMILNKKKQLQIKDSSVLWIILLNIINLMFSVFIAKNPINSIYMLINYFQAFLVFLFFVWFLDNDKSLKTVIKLYIIGSIIPVIIGLLQIINVLHVEEMNRIQGPFMSSNEFAPFLAFNFLFFISLARYEKRIYFKVGLIGLAIINLYIFFQTYSRGALIALAGSFISYIFLSIKSNNIRKYVLLTIIVVIIISSGLAIGISKYFVRFTEIGGNSFDFSTLERVGVWEAALRLFESSPIVGVGINNFHELYSKYFPTYGFRFTSYKLYHAHNLLLNTLAEQGLLGFIILIISFIVIMRLLFSIIKFYQNGLNANITPFLSSFFIYFVIHNIFDCVWTAYYHIALQMQLAFYFSLIIYLNKSKKIKSRESSEISY